MFKGSMVALVTPMDEQGGLDTRALKGLLDFHLGNGTDAIILLGTTGESVTLSPSEMQTVLELGLAHVAGKIPIIAGTGTSSTQKTVEYTKMAQSLGVQGCLVVTPYYNRPTQEGLYLHYLAIASAVECPIILYNVPGRTGCDMLPETVAKLSEIPNIVGLKEATSDLSRLKSLSQVVRSGFLLYSGDDASACDFMLQGGHGVISVTANVAPANMKALCDAALLGKPALAKQADEKCAALHQALFIEPNPIPVKYVLHRMGLIKRGIRLPLTWLNTEHEQDLILAMQEAGIH